MRVPISIVDILVISKNECTHNRQKMEMPKAKETTDPIR